MPSLLTRRVPLRIVACLVLLAALSPVATARADDMIVDIGRADAPLHGPWRFTIGDDPRWAAPAFDDAGWERVDLTPAPGAHDPDVGLTGYVGGWMARGHAGYHGFAWYRLHLRWRAQADVPLVLLGPPYVEDAYEIYWNGERLGASGDFLGRPKAYATRPSLFALPATGASGEAVIAIRVYMSPTMRREGDAGGMHIAPILAERSAGEARHAAQWSQTILGYVVDVIEPAIFLAIAAFALFVSRLTRESRFTVALAAALVLTAALRLNQAIYFWLSIEDLEAFTIVKGVILEPLGLFAWTVAWNRAAPEPKSALDRLAALLAVLSACAAVVGVEGESVRMMTRIGFALLLIVVAARVSWRGTDRPLLLAAMLLLSIGQFAEELWALGLPGIWFPYGIGVSRTQYAYALSMPVLLVLLARRALRPLPLRGPLS